MPSSTTLLEPKDIGRVRKQLGLTQSKLARLSGVSQSLIAKIEAGKIDPSFSKAKTLSETLQRLQRGSSKRAGDIMVSNVIAVRPADRLEQAVQLMEKHAISQLPVYENGRLVGSISEKTGIKLFASYADPKEVFQKSIREVMDPAFPTVGEETPVEVLYPLLDFFPAVMVTRRDQVVGIVTKADLLKLR